MENYCPNAIVWSISTQFDFPIIVAKLGALERHPQRSPLGVCVLGWKQHCGYLLSLRNKKVAP